MWQQWVNGILGLWILLSAFLPFQDRTVMWNLIIVGLAVTVLGFWSATSTSKGAPLGDNNLENP